MAFSLRLPGGMRVVISETDGIRFDSEPSQADIYALELCAQVLFKDVFRYSKAEKPNGIRSLCQPKQPGLSGIVVTAVSTKLLV